MKNTDEINFEDRTNAELFELYAKSKDLNVRNELVVRNQRLVSYILKKYYSTSRIPEETKKELLQEGMLGLLSAIEGFDHTLGYKFSTYASWWIRQAINNYLINTNPIIRVPGHVKAAQNKLFKELKLRKEDVGDFYNINPSDYNLSEKMLKSIGSAIKSRQISSLSWPVATGNDGKNITVEETIPSTEESSVREEENFDRKVMINIAKETLKAMPQKRKLILLLRYGVIKEKDIITKNKA